LDQLKTYKKTSDWIASNMLIISLHLMPKLLSPSDQKITNSKPLIFVFAWKASPHCSSDKFSIEAASDSNLAQLALTAS
jgi:hypothetical protein